MGYWLINTAGIGGLVVIVAFAILLLVYARVLRWIYEGGQLAEGSRIDDRAGGEGDASH